MSSGGSGHGSGVEVTGPVAEDDDRFFDAIRARMSDKDRRIMERLDALEAVYVECGRDKHLRETFDAFLQKYLTRKEGRRKQADVFFLTGASGAGKSEAIARLLRDHPLLQPVRTSFGVVRPYVSIALKGYVIPRIAAENVMREAGERFGKTGRGEAWDQMSDVLRRRRVFLVHIDETQHLIRKARQSTDDKASRTANEELANAIKGVSISPTWPVAFVLSGLPQIVELPIEDEQFEKRGWWVDFADLDMERERKLVVRILKELAEAVGFGIGNLEETDLPERMAHAGRYRFARVCEGVVAAIHQAMIHEPKARELTRGHFAMAYANQSRSRNEEGRNLFLVDDWAGMPQGSFLGRKEDEES